MNWRVRWRATRVPAGLRAPVALAGAVVLAAALTACADAPIDTAFALDIPDGVERVWVGPDTYANRLLDWRLRDGRVESVEGGRERPMRTLQLLTRTLTADDGSAHMEVRTGPLDPGPAHEDTWSGFLIGVGGPEVDYGISALSHHWPSTDGGMVVAVDGTGRIVVRDNSVNQGFAGPGRDVALEAWPLLEPTTVETTGHTTTDIRLALDIEAAGGGYDLVVTASDAVTGEAISEATYAGIAAGQIDGNMALVSHRSPKLEGPGYWFRDWRLSGDLVARHPEREFGPVLGAFHTLSDGVLKMTAQMPPLGSGDSPDASLEVWRDGAWVEVGRTPIREWSATAHFRVEDWDGSVETPYRVVYELVTEAGPARRTYQGVIRRIPSDRDELVLAAFTGHYISGGDGSWNSSHIWFPHAELTAAVARHDPDVLFFSGDQVYEGGLAGVVMDPQDVAALDYLYHWYRFVWAFRDLARDRPTITIPDDHDVYHGNIWGNGGVREDRDDLPVQDRGGYRMSPEWVNAVHRTQVAHLPDPVDPEPLPNGITVYHTRMEYAGISFAVLADRMWKSPPSVVVPEGRVVNGWPQNPDFHAPTGADVPDAVLLGQRQERFLEDWATDWSRGAWMKVVLSQTPFNNIATIPREAMSGSGIPGLHVALPGEYIEGDKKAADLDSNGWPSSGRDRALRSMRKGFAFHVAGDQHLASFTRYGIDDWGDAGAAFAMPSIANLWPRRWYPPEPGANRRPGAPRNTGDYLDGFGNRMTVEAVANPTQVGIEPTALYERAPGYGVIRFRRGSREIVSELWPRWVDPSTPDAAQYPGWPITLAQEDLYDRKPAAYLPTVVVEGMADPVILVADEATGETLYALRILGDRYRPGVFRTGGTYTVHVGEPGTQRMDTLEGVEPTADPNAELRIVFP